MKILESLANNLLIASLEIDRIKSMLKLIIVACAIGAVINLGMIIHICSNNCGFLTGFCLGSIQAILTFAACCMNGIYKLVIDLDKEINKIIKKLGDIQDGLNN